MICPDCKRPVASHAMFKGGRCPVVRFQHYDLDPGKPPTPIRPCPPRGLGQR